MCYVVKASLMTTEHFKLYVAWPGDKYYFFGGVGPADEARSFTTVNENFKTLLDELLRREDWA